MDSKGNGNEFIRKLVAVMIDEKRIIGNRQFISDNHQKVLDFKYPQELEVKIINAFNQRYVE